MKQNCPDSTLAIFKVGNMINEKSSIDPFNESAQTTKRSMFKDAEEMKDFYKQSIDGKSTTNA